MGVGVELSAPRARRPQTDWWWRDRKTAAPDRGRGGEGPQPRPSRDLDRLNADERQVFDELTSGAWGARVRLEQERLPWALVLAALQRLKP